jgi:hypothetical protein
LAGFDRSTVADTLRRDRDRDHWPLALDHAAGVDP